MGQATSHSVQRVRIARQRVAVSLDGIGLDRIDTIDQEDDSSLGQLEGVADEQTVPVLLRLNGVAQGAQHDITDEGRVQGLVSLELQRGGAGQHGEFSAR